MKRDVMINKINFFFNKSAIVHISCDGNRFYNGLILEIVGEDFILIQDRMLGETPIYFSEIHSIERFTEAGK